MQSINMDVVAWSSCLSVYRSVTTVSRAKTVEPTEVPFGVLTRVGQKNSVSGWDADPRRETGNFRVGRDRSMHCKISGSCSVRPAKAAESIEMSFGVWTCWDQVTIVLHGGLYPPWKMGTFWGRGFRTLKSMKIVYCLVYATKGMIQPSTM